MIGRVKTGSFEDHAASAANEARQPGLAALGAFFQFGFDHGLQGFKGVPAMFAFVLIGGHLI